MKKFYSVLAMAAAIVGTAAAGTVNTTTVAKNSNLATQAIEAVELEGNLAVSSKSEVAPKELSSVDQVCNVYSFSDYQWMLKGDDPGIGTAVIAPVEGNTVEVIFGSYSHFPITSTVDLANSTLTMKTADNKNVYYAESLDKYLSLELRVPDKDNKYTQNVDEATFKIQADGTINLGAVAIMGTWGGDSYNFGFAEGVMHPYNKWTYKASEWETLADKAVVDEFVFNPAYSAPVEPQPTTLMVNKTEPNIFLLYKPYTVGGWAQRNATVNDEGFLYVDMTNKDCVLLRPLVWCGFTLRYSGGETEAMYPYNNEGYRVYLEDWTQDELIEEAELVMEDGESLQDYLSYYDSKNNEVVVKNVVFGNAQNPVANLIWTAQKNLWYKIALPESYGAGVADITVDDNAPVKYYNLQGVEISNPAAGELVIVKQGAKVSKSIVK
ncbi:MAG: hypothetical protein HDS79_03975 [Bacteroidales bacterium]|nr:hypothetical protein [Bacteroidales bacterium]